MYKKYYQLRGFFLIVLCSQISIGLFANNKIVDNYIMQYKDLAIQEMKRTGIPASIKLAQAITESDLGRSPLASEANNHFGIKCGKNWNGDTYFKVDDDKDTEGNNIESCFRSYIEATESFIDHSNFLTDPAKSSRYGFLFNLSTKDYIGWAEGLKFSGYATDPKYATKLINIIEKYKLMMYDDISDQKVIASTPTKAKKPKLEDEPKVAQSNTVHKNKKSVESVVTYKYNTNQINGLKMIHADGGETIKAVALANRINVYELMEYNELIKSEDYVLAKDEIVFLEKKKKFYEDDNLLLHTVSDLETLYSIAQKYGIRLENLQAKNNLKPNTNPKRGELISINRHLGKNETPKYIVAESTDKYLDFGDVR